MIAWMLYAVLVTAMLSAAALAAERGLTLLRRPVRFVWTVTMVAGVVLPLVGLALARPDPVVEVAAPAAQAPDAGLWLAPTVTFERVGTATAAVNNMVAVLWVAASLVLLAALVWSRVRLLHARASWEREVVDGHEVHVSGNLGPAVVGPIGGEIVVPRWLLRDASPAERRAALRHEREHVEARDALLVWLGALAAVAFPWNAPLWWQLRRLRAAVELDCDRRVLAAGESSATYADLLLRVGDRRGALLLGPALTEPRSLLARRIEAMIDTPIGHGVWRVLPYGAIAVVLVALACDTPVPTTAEDPTASTERLQLDLGEVYADNAPGVTPPERVSCPPTDYPAALRESGVEGQVLLHFVIERDGLVRAGNIEILSSSHSGFDSAATAMIAGCRFRPGKFRGAAIRTLVEMPIVFTLAARPTSAQDANSAPTTIILRASGAEAEESAPPRYILDGVVLDQRPRMDSLRALDIESIEVLKGEEARRRYGEGARNGVVLITTKGSKRN